MIGRSFNKIFEQSDKYNYFGDQKEREIGYSSLPSDREYRFTQSITNKVDLKSNWLSKGEIGPTFYDIFQNNSRYNIWGDTRKHLVNADLTLCNLKNCITHYPIKFPQKPNCYKLQPQYSDILKAGGIDYCNLANDHAMDFMGNGMLDTRYSLNELGIRYTGSGNNIDEASEPVYFKKKDTTIGILSASDHYRWFGAEEKIAGIRYIDITQNGWWNIIKQIQEMKKKCDFIIFSFNWKMKINKVESFAKKLIDYGVNVVYGCSAHKILPIEKYKHGLIIYSSGNFIDDYKVTNHKNNLSYITDVYVDNGNIYCIKIRPTSRNLHQVNFAKGQDYTTIMKVANFTS